MKSRGVGGDQDGRIEGCETPFSQKYIYMWNYSHRLLTDHWQKFHTIKDARKITL